MKTIQDLQNIVTETLENAGFKRIEKDVMCSDGSVHSRNFSKEGDTWRTPVKGYNFTEFNGKRISFVTVYRSNGTDENRSIRVEVGKYKESIGCITYRAKIYGKNGDKKIQNIIAEAIAAYEAI